MNESDSINDWVAPTFRLEPGLHLVLMLKYPTDGTVKTRLIPALGERRATALYRALVRYTLEQARRFAAQSAASLTLRVAGAPDDLSVRRWLGERIRFQAQGTGDLGSRLERAVSATFDEGASAVIVIGADCPQLSSKHLQAAGRALAQEDVVFGPAADGGYYLIGLRRFLPELFHGIAWSTDRVLEQSLSAARHAGVHWRLLETLSDLDRPEDLPVWAQSSAALAVGQGKLSIIIPALNEAPVLAQTLESVQRGQPHEVIVVDGGSTDETLNVARSWDAIVLSAPRGRAIQLNRGAAIATGEYLLFLHADTTLPLGYAGQVSAVLGEPGVVGGAFRLAIAGEFAGRRWVERGANWRASRRQLPYGDQALFLRRETFTRLDGFAELPIMEDYEFVRRLRRAGRIVLARASAVTAGRRWQRLGWARTTLRNQAIILAYRLGLSPYRLARWYRGAGPRPAREGSRSPHTRLGSLKTKKSFK